MKRILAGERYRIRFRNNLPLRKVQDSVYGELKQEKQDQLDFVLAGSDLRPTERFMRIVDSIDVRLTHYVHDYRYVGEVWSVLAMFQVLGIPEPKAMHLPRVNLAGYAPSFRVEWLKQTGYSPEAVINVAALLGWQPFGSSLEN